MSWFRRPFDPRYATARLALPHDAKQIGVLGRRAPWYYLTSSLEEAVALVPNEPTAVLEYDKQIVAALQVGWRLSPNAWLRTVLIDSRVDIGPALRLMLPHIYQALPSRDIAALYVTIDPWSEPWLRIPLEESGFAHIMDVWSYQKEALDIPSMGNQDVTVRYARPNDLPKLLEVDVLCFPAPWAKGQEILEPAVLNAPYFAVAEWNGEIIGYSHVTLHYHSRQAHLVRIAVKPEFQGRAVGVRLLAEVVQFCQHQRVDRLTLNTQAGNKEAQRLYEWFGFRRTGDAQAVLGVQNLT
jgi:ribosomal-protein-alanine N-acetyltransferase